MHGNATRPKSIGTNLFTMTANKHMCSCVKRAIVLQSVFMGLRYGNRFMAYRPSLSLSCSPHFPATSVTNANSRECHIHVQNISNAKHWQQKREKIAHTLNIHGRNDDCKFCWGSVNWAEIVSPLEMPFDKRFSMLCERAQYSTLFFQCRLVDLHQVYNSCAFFSASRLIYFGYTYKFSPTYCFFVCAIFGRFVIVCCVGF